MLPVSLAPKTLGEAMEFSKLLAQSSMVPTAYKGKPADILVAVQWGAELGLAPLQAMQNIALINGKPSVYGDAALGLVKASAVCADVEEFLEGEGQAMVATCIATRKNCKPVVAKFSVADAKAAGLWNKSGPWSQYPKRMLQMRARGFALRDAFPDVLKGLITSEEAMDYPASKEKDITPTNPLDNFAPVGKLVEKIAEKFDPPAPVTFLVDAPEEAQGAPSAAIDGEVIAEGEPAPIVGRRFPLLVPGGEVVAEHSDVGAWTAAYAEMMDRLAASKKYAPRTKMTKLRELKEANDTIIHHLDAVTKAGLVRKYQGILRTLGAEMNEAEKEGDDAS
jgi:hypothetical protein